MCAYRQILAECRYFRFLAKTRIMLENTFGISDQSLVHRGTALHSFRICVEALKKNKYVRRALQQCLHGKHKNNIQKKEIIKY